MTTEADWTEGILGARPEERPHAERPGSGTFPLRLGQDRDGLVHVPASIQPGRAAPLLIMLHGAGASSFDVMPMVVEQADRHAVLVVAPDSRGATWDVIRRGYGPDVEFLDRALDTLFARYSVDAARIAVAGFSDGASYALSLGLINGFLFKDILAFSPGFAAPTRTEGSPHIFISHGRDDSVLPIERCGRRIAASLKRAGYDVDCREFAGGHVVPTDMVSEAFAQFLGA